MIDIEKLVALPFIEQKGQKVDKIYQMKTGEVGVLDEVFKRVMSVDNGVTDSFRLRSYGLEITGSYPQFESSMDEGRGGKFQGRVGLLIVGWYLGEAGWKNYLVTFKHTVDSCMNEYEPTSPDLRELLKDLITEVYSKE